MTKLGPQRKSATENTENIFETLKDLDLEVARDKIVNAFKETLKAIKEFAEHTSESMSIAMDRVIDNYDEYQTRIRERIQTTTTTTTTTPPAITNTTKTQLSDSSQPNENATAADNDEFTESQLLLIKSMEDLGLPTDKIRDAIKNGCDTEKRIMEYIIPPPSSKRISNTNTSRSLVTNTDEHNIIGGQNQPNTDHTEKPVDNTNSSMDFFQMTQSWIAPLATRLSIPNINMAHTVDAITNNWFFSSSTSNTNTTTNTNTTPATTAAVPSSSSSTTNTPITNRNRRTSSAASGPSVSSSASTDKEYLLERKKILSLTQQQVEILPIQDVRKYLRFLLVKHGFEDPHDKLRDMLWKAICRNR